MKTVQLKDAGFNAWRKKWFPLISPEKAQMAYDAARSDTFQPITVVLETEEEAAMMRVALGFSSKQIAIDMWQEYIAVYADQGGD